MKIGILTFFYSNNNYGQVLQCYALQEFLKNLGHDVFLINYDYHKDIIKKPFIVRCFKLLNFVNLISYIKYKQHSSSVISEEQKNGRLFLDFKKKYINCYDIFNTYLDLKNRPPEANIYIVGSDQVWNFWFKDIKRHYNQIHTYFLDFGNSTVKRLSYAASWGMETITPDYAKEITPLLQRFDYVSVREESGMELCRKCGRDDAEWVCDPTLLLNADTYRNLYKENEIHKPSKQFLLLYILNNSCNFDLQKVYDFAISKGLDVIYVTGNGVVDKREKYYATIPEWLWLVDNAEYVITNSFHCGIFCTIFNKRFGIIPLSDDCKEMNSRFESLFSLRGIGNRYISDKDFSVLDIDYKVEPVYPSNRFLEALNCHCQKSQ